MKKNIIVILSLILTLHSKSQNASFEKGDKLINIGVGVNSYYNGGIPFGASAEYGINENISIGGNFDYLSYNYSNIGLSNYRFSVLYFGARASYHLNNLLHINEDKIDFYVGGILGYRRFSWSDNFYNGALGNSYGSSLYVGGYVGGKYFFTPTVSGFSELGAIGSTNFRLGIGFKF